MKMILKMTSLIALLFFFTQCISNEREGCDGYPVLVNPIPDTTLTLNQDTLIIDLQGSSNSVFDHTSGEGLSFNYYSNISVFLVHEARENNTRRSFARIPIEQVGSHEITFVALDICEFQSTDEFQLIITNE